MKLKKAGEDIVDSQERLAFSVDEARRLLGLGRGSMYEAVRTGQIPSIRIGRRIIIPRVGIEQLLAKASMNTLQSKIGNTDNLGENGKGIS